MFDMSTVQAMYSPFELKSHDVTIRRKYMAKRNGFVFGSRHNITKKAQML